MAANFLESLFGLRDQNAVVIGGTGTLGGAVAEGLAKAGAHVVIAGRSEERGRQRVDAIVDQGGSASFHSVDACNRDSLTVLREDIVNQFHSVEMLVNCAGVNSAVPYEEISDEQWREVVDGNLTATHLGCQVFVHQMTRQPNGGAILNIGSVTAHLPLSRVYAYSAAKAGVVNLTKNLAREYASRNVRVNVICPGFFPAEQNRKILTPERTKQIFEQTPMGRFGNVEELVGAVLLMLSHTAGSYLTGAELYVDGGFTAMRF